MIGSLVMARALMGFSAAFCIPAALAFIVAHHPEPTRSRAVGAHQAGIVYTLTLLLRSPERSRPPEAPAVARPGSVALGLLADRNFILLSLAFTLPAIAGWVVRDWMPEIIRERFALGQGAAGHDLRRLRRRGPAVGGCRAAHPADPVATSP